MNRCILHVGLPKTGTTAIEWFLRKDLSDPAFLNCRLGDVGTGRALAALSGDPSDLSMKNAAMGWSDRQWSDYRLRMEEEWAQSLQTATQRRATWVISAEFCWFMSPAGLARLQRQLVADGFEVSVMVYLRPWKAWLESMAQQGLIGVHGNFSADLPWELKDFRGRIQLFDNLFGKHAVQVAKYDPSSFEGGCVVRDFCRRFGIRLTGNRTYRIHGSLKLPALRLLYAYRRHGPGFGIGPTALQENRRMLHALTQVEGPALRFHSSLMEPILAELEPQRSWLEDRMGASFREDPYRDDAGTTLREEGELLHFSPMELAWLAGRSGSRQVAAGDRETVARQVAEQVHLLRKPVDSTWDSEGLTAWAMRFRNVFSRFVRS